MDDGPRKRSSFVTLTLIGLPLGAVALANIPEPQEFRRNIYTDRAACERDYSAPQCEQGTRYASAGYGWHGPYYSGSGSGASMTGDPGPGRSGQATRSEVSSRGGFGAFGRAMRAVG